MTNFVSNRIFAVDTSGASASGVNSLMERVAELMVQRKKDAAETMTGEEASATVVSGELIISTRAAIGKK